MIAVMRPAPSVTTILATSALLLGSIGLSACSTPTAAQAAANRGWTVYGNFMETSAELHPEVTAAGIAQHPEWIGTRRLLVISGTVAEVCRTMGCWLEIEDANGERMLVMNRDHAFFVPRNCRGREVHVIGQAVEEEQSVDMLRHLAMDAGKSEAEIAKITEPARRLVFIAEAIILPPGGLEKPVEPLRSESALDPTLDTSMTPGVGVGEGGAK